MYNNLIIVDYIYQNQNYYNEERCHHSIDGITPLKKADESSITVVSIDKYRWKKHCKGLFELPIAA